MDDYLSCHLDAVFAGIGWTFIVMTLLTVNEYKLPKFPDMLFLQNRQHFALAELKESLCTGEVLSFSLSFIFAQFKNT